VDEAHAQAPGPFRRWEIRMGRTGLSEREHEWARLDARQPGSGFRYALAPAAIWLPALMAGLTLAAAVGWAPWMLAVIGGPIAIALGAYPASLRARRSRARSA